MTSVECVRCSILRWWLLLWWSSLVPTKLLFVSSGENACCCSTHALAEVYATLTALPLKRRISPDEARRLVEDTVLDRLEVIPLSSADYRTVLRQVADRGLGSGAIYDALHAHCVRKEGVDQILTYNLSDFERFDLDGILVAAP